MAFSRLLYASCIMQACGALLLYLCGAFAPTGHAPGCSAFWRKPAFALALAGAVLMMIFALLQRHFLLLAGEVVFIILCCLALDRKGKGAGS